MEENIVDYLLNLLKTKGADIQYGNEDVTQLEHALQCAELAEKHKLPGPTIAAALLHDVGQHHAVMLQQLLVLVIYVFQQVQRIGVRAQAGSHPHYHIEYQHLLFSKDLRGNLRYFLPFTFIINLLENKFNSNFNKIDQIYNNIY